MENKTPSVRERILIAAFAVVGETGAGHLTLDRVAASCEISKGGLLYHFPNKRALIMGMIEHFLANLEKDIDVQIASNEKSDNPMLNACITVLSQRTESHKVQLRALLAATADNLELMAPAIKFTQMVFNRIKTESSDPTAALVTFLACEGIRFLELFDLLTLEKHEVDLVIERLLEFSKSQ